MVEPAAGRAATWPLVVDLDGTLTASDTLVESFLALLRVRPWAALASLWALRRGRAAFKQAVAGAGAFDARHLPLRPDLLDYLAGERARGRAVVLATAADRSVAEAVARRLGVFDRVLASDGVHNLKGSAKLEAIRRECGEAFSYVGDSRADLPIWRAARSAVLVAVDPALARQAAGVTTIEREFAAPPAGAAVWAQLLRLHQWLKNLLVLVPLLTSFSMASSASVGQAMLAVLAMSLLASATYVFNDLWDLDHDRRHPRKRLRPLAAGQIGVPAAVAVALGMAGAAAGLGWTLGPPFVACAAGYAVLTAAYSVWLKRKVLVDVIALALLYGVRVLAGAAAISVQVTPWLFAFCLFVFFSLALLKRCSELVALREAGGDRSAGRGYRVGDLSVLWPLGVGAGMSAVVVFGLFIAEVGAAGRYRHPELLWGVGVALLYWLARMWLDTARGTMHDDPIVHTLRRRAPAAALALMVVLTLAAHLL